MYFNPWQEVTTSQRNLPQWHQENSLYFVTFRLADSIPIKKLRMWREQKQYWEAEHSPPYSIKEINDYESRFPQRLNHWLDSGMGACLLNKEDNIRIIADALHFYHNQRYTLGDWVIMPNHVHMLIQPTKDEALSKILHSIKSYTANQINRNEARTGTLWQQESYSRIVRSQKEHSHFQHYIRDNPAKAGIQVPPCALSSNIEL